jgi:nucleotide-binding universal stress UspA family protein
MFKKIMIPLDGSQIAECVLPHLQNLTRPDEPTEILLFEICEPPVILADFPATLTEDWDDHVRKETAHMQQQCSLYLNQIAQRIAMPGVTVTSKTAVGKAAELIVDYAVQNQVDLILMATHGRSGIMRWAYGSTADRVLRASPVPVMIVRPEECKIGNG